MNSKCQKLFCFIKTVNIDFLISLRGKQGKKLKLSSFDFLLDGIYLSETPVASSCSLYSLFCTKDIGLLFSLHMKEMRV